MKQYLIVVLFCISLITGHAEHLFIELLAICVFFRKMCVQVLYPFLKQVVFFVIELYELFIHILDINFLLHI